jgi:hypothetical protein
LPLINELGVEMQVGKPTLTADSVNSQKASIFKKKDKVNSYLFSLENSSTIRQNHPFS